MPLWLSPLCNCGRQVPSLLAALAAASDDALRAASSPDTLKALVGMLADALPQLAPGSGAGAGAGATPATAAPAAGTGSRRSGRRVAGAGGPISTGPGNQASSSAVQPPQAGPDSHGGPEPMDTNLTGSGCGQDGQQGAAGTASERPVKLPSPRPSAIDTHRAAAAGSGLEPDVRSGGLLAARSAGAAAAGESADDPQVQGAVLIYPLDGPSTSTSAPSAGYGEAAGLGRPGGSMLCSGGSLFGSSNLGPAPATAEGEAAAASRGPHLASVALAAAGAESLCTGCLRVLASAAGQGAGAEACRKTLIDLKVSGLAACAPARLHPSVRAGPHSAVQWRSSTHHILCYHKRCGAVTECRTTCVSERATWRAPCGLTQ